MGSHGHDDSYFYFYLDHPCLSEPEPGPSHLQQSVRNVDLGAREDLPNAATVGPVDESLSPGPEPGPSSLQLPVETVDLEARENEPYNTTMRPQGHDTSYFDLDSIIPSLLDRNQACRVICASVKSS